jgi:hypothetical protein
MNEIYENIDFDNFLFLECDYISFYIEFIEKFDKKLNRNFYQIICQDFESEYHNVNLSFNIKQLI